jgi:long-chain acyl-CoA synthetase
MTAISKDANLSESPRAPRNLGDLLSQRVAASPDKDFLFCENDGRRFSYMQFQRAVNRVSRLLQSHDVGKGDVVSLLMPNGAEYIIAYFACWQLGALAGPVNSLLKEEEISFVLNNSEAKTILLDSEFQARIDNIRHDLTNLKSVIVFDN